MESEPQRCTGPDGRCRSGVHQLVEGHRLGRDLGARKHEFGDVLLDHHGFDFGHAAFILAFALGCALSSAYGFLSNAWPFGTVEAIWTVIALRRYSTTAAR